MVDLLLATDGERLFPGVSEGWTFLILLFLFVAYNWNGKKPK